MPRGSFRKILVPVTSGPEPGSAIWLAFTIAEAAHVVLAGIIGISEDESLSAAALPARQLRKRLRQMAAKRSVRVMQRIRVSHKPWDEVLQAVKEEQPDLLILDASELAGLRTTVRDVLQNPPCDMIVAGGAIPDQPADVLCALRGGPHAELALKLSLAIARTSGARITALHLTPKAGAPVQDAAFKGVDRVLRNLPQVERRYVETDNPAEEILQVRERIRSSGDRCKCAALGWTKLDWPGHGEDPGAAVKRGLDCQVEPSIAGEHGKRGRRPNGDFGACRQVVRREYVSCKGIRRSQGSGGPKARAEPEGEPGAPGAQRGAHRWSRDPDDPAGARAQGAPAG